jgi:hypothetical protein
VLSEAYGGEAVKKSSAFEWYKRFKEGRENVENDEKSGRSRSRRTDENVGKVRNLMLSDRRLSIRVIAVKLNLDKETVERGLNFCLIGFSTTTMLQLKRRCQEFPGTKIDY